MKHPARLFIILAIIVFLILGAILREKWHLLDHRDLRDISLGQSIQDCPSPIYEGKMSLTIDSVTVADCYQEMLTDGTYHYSDINTWSFDENGEETDKLDFPRFIEENGGFPDGFFMVYISVTIENIDCALIPELVSEYLNENLYSGIDPTYVFSAQLLSVKPESASEKENHYPVYFSHPSDFYEKDDELFFLPPGKTLSFTLGYWMGPLNSNSALSTEEIVVLYKGKETIYRLSPFIS